MRFRINGAKRQPGPDQSTAISGLYPLRQPPTLRQQLRRLSKSFFISVDGDEPLEVYLRSTLGLPRLNALGLQKEVQQRDVQGWRSVFLSPFASRRRSVLGSADGHSLPDAPGHYFLQ